MGACFFSFFVACICGFCYLIGFLFCQHSGQYWLQMFDNYCATLPLLFIGFFELVGVSYIYTIERWGHLDIIVLVSNSDLVFSLLKNQKNLSFSWPKHQAIIQCITGSALDTCKSLARRMQFFVQVKCTFEKLWLLEKCVTWVLWENSVLISKSMSIYHGSSPWFLLYYYC